MNTEPSINFELFNKLDFLNYSCQGPLVIDSLNKLCIKSVIDSLTSIYMRQLLFL